MAIASEYTETCSTAKNIKIRKRYIRQRKKEYKLTNRRFYMPAVAFSSYH
jgi:hypothetical protein